MPKASNLNLARPPIQAQHVTEFNQSGTNPIGEYSVIYQYGYSEVGAFYMVSANTIKNQSWLATDGFNLTLPAEYYKYWNLSYINYFNLTSIVDYNLSDKYLLTETGNETLSPAKIVSLTSKCEDIKEIKSGYQKISALRLYFSELLLRPGDQLLIFNRSMDIPIYNLSRPINSIGDLTVFEKGNLSQWINSDLVNVVLKS